MPVTDSSHILYRSAQQIMYRVGEFVHVAAIYLGIAVLVSVVLTLTVPSLQDQSRQLREAVIAVFQPDTFDESAYSLFDAGAGPGDSGQADTQSTTATESRPSGPMALPGNIPPEERHFTSAQTNFSAAVRAATSGKLAPGLGSAQAKALRNYLGRKYRIAESVAGAIVNTVFIMAKERGLDPQLVLAVIAIESRYNPFAESHVGAQGLMQVLTSVHKDKFSAFEEGITAAINPIANIWVGTAILDNCINRRGSVAGGLACYVGATGPGDGGYGARVLAERRRIALASGIPLPK
jgi:soluble lytic murein transglycosylase-like protein